MATIDEKEALYAERIGRYLTDYYRLFPSDANRLEVLNKQIAERAGDLCNRKTLPGHLTASALVWHRPSQTVLLIHHNALKRWLQPGGHMESGEDPLAGSRRELEEEVGSLPVHLHAWHDEHGVCLDVDSHVIPANDKKQEPQHLHHDFLYIYILKEKQALALQADEVSDCRWVPLSELPSGEFGKRLVRVAQKLSGGGLQL